MTNFTQYFLHIQHAFYAWLPYKSKQLFLQQINNFSSTCSCCGSIKSAARFLGLLVLQQMKMMMMMTSYNQNQKPRASDIFVSTFVRSIESLSVRSSVWGSEGCGSSIGSNLNQHHSGNFPLHRSPNTVCCTFHCFPLTLAQSHTPKIDLTRVGSFPPTQLFIHNQAHTVFTSASFPSSFSTFDTRRML